MNLFRTVAMALGSMLVSTTPSNAESGKQGTFAVEVPVNEANLKCYDGSVSLAWKGQPGIWELQGEPSEYNGLWERSGGHSAQRSCAKIGDLLALAMQQNGGLAASLTVTQARQTVCYSGHYGPDYRYCIEKDIVDAKLEFPLGVTLSEVQIL